MNDAPVPPFQPTPTEENNPVIQPAVQVATQPQTPHSSQTLSLWSMILGIVALVLGIVVFISIPAAIIAVVLGIIVLTKHHPGKGKALAGIITGGVALILIPVLFAVTLVAYNGITQRANELQKTTQQHETASTSSDGTTVTTPCYTYTIPSSYEYDDASAHCTTAVNMPNADMLTRITVKGNTGTIGTLQDVVTLFNKTIQNGDPKAPGVVDQETLTINGRTAYYVSYKDSYGLLFGNYIFPDSSASQKDTNGKTITAYTVAGYTYNSGLKALVRGVADTLVIK
ncbi:MAG TPA: DUF4190 domain-containing protein [Candidatus Microsaccharimonas sp.]|jgi:hypothetical protein